MFTLKHQVNRDEYVCYSCNHYRAIANAKQGCITIFAQDDDRGMERRIDVWPSERVYVMGRDGKNIEVIRTQSKDAPQEGM